MEVPGTRGGGKSIAAGFGSNAVKKGELIATAAGRGTTGNTIGAKPSVFFWSA